MIWNKLLSAKVLENSLQDWLVALLILLISYFLLQMVKRLAARHLKQMTQRKPTAVSDFVTDLLANTWSAVLIIFSVFFASQQLHLSPSLVQLIRMAAIFAILLQIGTWLTAFISFWGQREAGRKQASGSETTTISILGLMLKIAVWVLLFLLALDNIPGIQITTLIASLGIGGIAVGLAVQSILSDIFASVSIALDKPFVIGDTIAVDGVFGKVEHIGLKSVRVRSLAGQQIVYSTSDLPGSRIHNYRKMERRQVLLKLGVSYDTPQQKAAMIPEMIREIVEQNEQVTFERSHFTGFSDFALNFETVYFIEGSNYTLYMDVQQAVGFAILQAFEKEGISFAIPTQTILLGKTVEPEALVS